MAYVAQHLILMPNFQCNQGENVDMAKCPPGLLRQLIQDKGVILVGEPETVMAGLEDLFKDALSEMTMPQLVTVFKLNNMANYFTPMSNWTTEHMRQAIRGVSPDLSNLRLSADASIGQPKAAPVPLEMFPQNHPIDSPVLGVHPANPPQQQLDETARILAALTGQK